MEEERKAGNLVDLQSRTGYKPDIAALARNQLAAARASQELTQDEFAELLTPLVGWPVTRETIEAWETTSVPPGDVLVAAGLATHSSPLGSSDGQTTDLVGRIIGDRFSDVTAVYPSRSEFTSNMPPHSLFDEATEVRAAGLSLNLLCQQYSISRLGALIEAGTEVRCLFLDPDGDAIKSREIEEGYPAGHLSALTALNIQTLQHRVRNQLSEEVRERLKIAIYDETIRFNIITIDARLCVIQPYLPGTRGVDSPTFIVQRRWPAAGLFPLFDQIFSSLWEKGQPV